jgi:outer membrane protein OmpA-like peptidoglycan-associated protein
MRLSTSTLICGILASASAALAQSQSLQTSIPAVTATVTFARQYGGVLHVGVTLKNTGDKEARQSEAIKFSEIVLVDAAAKRKHFAMKDADNHFLGGPISDWNDGGRWFVRIAPKGEVVLWTLFEAIPSGAKLSMEIPLVGSFDSIAMTEGPPSPAKRLASSQPSYGAALVSAARSPGQLKVQIKLDNPESRAALGGQALEFRDVYALDAAGKRKFPLLKSATGLYLAEPRSDTNDGGRLFLSKVQPRGEMILNLTFQPPPDSVKTVDIVLPFFPPFEAVALSGTSGAGQSGVAVAGRSEALEQAMKDLNAAETPQEIKVNLSADVLFDFDKADLKPAAQTSLEKLATVVKSYPTAQVYVEGHTDGKGSDSYNQPLSERRAATVGKWLVANAGLTADRLHTRGWGKAKPVAPNTKPNGADDPDGRAKNRRVEITVKK